MLCWCPAVSRLISLPIHCLHKNLVSFLVLSSYPNNPRLIKLGYLQPPCCAFYLLLGRSVYIPLLQLLTLFSESHPSKLITNADHICSRRLIHKYNRFYIVHHDNRDIHVPSSLKRKFLLCHCVPYKTLLTGPATQINNP